MSDHSSAWADGAVRAGLVVYGAVSLLIAALAARLALGDRNENVSTKGALRQLADAPFGQGLLLAAVVGLGALVIWRLTELASDYDGADGADLARRRAGSAIKAGVYAALMYSAAKVALGDHSGGGNTRSMTARLLDLPFGPALVVAVGVAVAGFGGAQARTGLSRDHADKLAQEGRRGEAGELYLKLGMVGYTAKGAVLVLVGGFICWAGFTHDPKKSAGMDQALGRLLGQPFGTALVLAVAVGIACYGLFTLARARHLSR